MFFTFAAVLLIACETREEPIQFKMEAEAAYTFTETANTVSFSITGNIPWKAEVTTGGDWCRVTPNAAQGNGKVEISVTANTAYLLERTAMVTVTAAQFSKQITVKQASRPCPAFSAGSIADYGQTLFTGGTPATINNVQPATGGDGVISYQWYKNNAAISGATATSYTPPPADAAAAGTHTYTRRAKDNTCNATPAPSAGSWVLAVATCNFNAGAIASSGQTLPTGGTPTIINSTQPASGGDGVISYQWYKNNAVISGATATSYTPPQTDANTVGTYTYTRRAKDNTCNTTLTQSTGSWALTVICPAFDAGAIATEGQVVTTGGTPQTINSVQDATGNGTVSYQWYKNNVVISGATAANYTPPQTDANTVGAHTYTRYAKDNTCNTTLIQSTGNWVLTVTCPAFNAGAIASTGQTATVGSTPQTINSTQDATGNGTISYQWYKNGNAINGATAANYTPPQTDANTVGTYTYTRRAKENTCNTTLTQSTGSWALIVICPAFDAGAIDSAGETMVVGGTPAAINSTQDATGNGTVSYQWYKNGNAINGATAANYTPPQTDANTVGTYTYTRRAKDNTCNTTLIQSAGSWVLTVTCSAFNAGAIASTGQTAAVGSTPETINSTQDATGGGTISYQWYKNGVAISGATAANYTPPQTDANTVGTYTYTRYAKDNICNTTLTQSTGSWALTVICPAFDAGAIDYTGETIVVGGTPATINSTQDATGNGTVSYQWYKNGNAINGATAANYTPPQTDASTIGTYTYTRYAKDNTCNTTLTQSTGSWVLIVATCNFSAGAIATTGQTICSGSAVNTITSITDASGGDGNIAYQWRRYYNGSGWYNEGTNAATYSPVNYNTNVGTHTFTRWAHDGNCKTDWTQSAGSWVLIVTEGTKITLLTANDNQTVANGAEITPIRYTATNTSGVSVNNLPAGITTSYAGNTLTISGRSTVAGMHTYVIRATGMAGCSDAYLGGSIKIYPEGVDGYGCVTSNLSLGTVGFASNVTHVVGSQTWSAPVTATFCEKTSSNGGTTDAYQADCRHETNDTYGHLFTWCMVENYAEQLCPSPWRTPSREDFCTMLNVLNGNTNCGYVGGWLGVSIWGAKSCSGCYAYYWSSSVYDSSTAGYGYFGSEGVLSFYTGMGKQATAYLRCVK
jgi:hypothetical protein